MRKERFTLIELLVVIAIISILMSILIPSLKRALEHAKAMQCAGNLKQAYLGFTLYAIDYNDIMPNGAQVNLTSVDANAGLELYHSYKITSDVVNCPAQQHLEEMKGATDNWISQYAYIRKWPYVIPYANLPWSHHWKPGDKMPMGYRYWGGIGDIDDDVAPAYPADQFWANTYWRKAQIPLRNKHITPTPKLTFEPLYASRRPLLWDQCWRPGTTSASASHQVAPIGNHASSRGGRPSGTNISFADGHVSWDKSFSVPFAGGLGTPGSCYSGDN